MNFVFVDWLVVFIYAVTVLTVGLYIVKKPKTSEGYFLANRQLRWPLIGASMLVSNISAEHFVGLAGLGFAVGWAAASYEVSAIFCMIPLVVIFLPFFIKTKVFTVPEFLERRLSPGSRTMYSLYMIILSVVQKVSIALWAAGLVFHQLMGWHPMTVIAVIALVVAVYTMKGGLTAVVYTDFIQTTVLIVAGIILMVKGLQATGGPSALIVALPEGKLHMMRPITDPEIPWLGFWVGMMIAASANWSTDQVLVQRVLAARDLNEGKKGVVFCQFLKLLTPFILILPGLMAYVLFRDSIHSPDEAYPTLLMNLMPHGLLGLTIAGIAAALMGHLSATFNSIATMFTRDFYIKWRPDADHQRQIAVGRIAVLIVAVLGIAWVPIINQFEFLWSYLARISVYLMIPYAVVFFGTVLWKRANSQGAWAAVIMGLLLTPIMMVDSQIHFIPVLRDIDIMRPYLNSSLINLGLCALALVLVSLMTPPPPKDKVAETTLVWGDLLKKREHTPRVPIINDYRPWFVLVILIAAAVVYITR
ncbi:MAG: sodium/solute symporter [Armatimonadetes bacterium]|nr:sodium/solute symporter [Armatimonadota bacterium]